MKTTISEMHPEWRTSFTVHRSPFTALRVPSSALSSPITDNRPPITDNRNPLSVTCNPIPILHYSLLIIRQSAVRFLSSVVCRLSSALRSPLSSPKTDNRSPSSTFRTPHSQISDFGFRISDSFPRSALRIPNSAFGSLRNPFTLIELLVVISIISILMAMLLPALKQARAEAKFISCKNNQKQLGLCMLMYEDDHNQYMPTPWNKGYSTLIRDQWDSTDVCTAMGLGTLYATGYCTSPGIGVCPDTTIPKDADTVETNPTILENLSYVIKNGKCSASYTIQSSYWLNTVNSNYQTPITTRGGGYAAYSWEKTVDWYQRDGIALRLDGNMPGGKFERYTATLRSPRAILSCATPNAYGKAIRPHNYLGTNVLFADGISNRLKLNGDIVGSMLATSSAEIFIAFLIPAYPNYQPPQ